MEIELNIPPLSIVFVFVLMGWSLLPNALQPFKIYCAPLNLSITRTWICRLNFTQRPIFSCLRSLTSLKSQTRDPSLKSLPENFSSGFLCPEKIHRPQPRLNPRTLDLEASTLPGDHRGRQGIFLKFRWIFYASCSYSYFKHSICNIVIDILIYLLYIKLINYINNNPMVE